MDTSKLTGNKAPRTLTKGEATKRRILDAARKVFSEHPYHAASVRMVGKAGGFDHPIIHYYFPKKVGLFESVMEEHVTEFRLFMEHWFDGLGAYSTDKGLAVFIERVIAFHLSNKDLFRTLMQNTSHVENFDQFPASAQFAVFHDSFLKTFRKKIRHKASDEEVSKFVYSFTVLAANYLGASSTYARFLGMDGECDAYWSWVKETIHYLFLPRMEKIIFNSHTK
ncbi:TetR/AcrR family transcriptional regulator [Desulfoluna sp.]|uniref:TetR/AcrR family transcriptional regulator n=1 Tax=Desulfoluna sp. TaxID=2045199 RepID=UPI002630BBB3|nr:TetR/AcrR family transcriptional regulator [Desulfoluna sp.]